MKYNFFQKTGKLKREIYNNLNKSENLGRELIDQIKNPKNLRKKIDDHLSLGDKEIIEDSNINNQTIIDKIHVLYNEIKDILGKMKNGDNSKTCIFLKKFLKLMTEFQSGIQPLFQIVYPLFLDQVFNNSQNFIDRVNSTIRRVQNSLEVVDFNYQKTFYLGMPNSECMLHLLEFCDLLDVHHSQDLKNSKERIEELLKKIKERELQIKNISSGYEDTLLQERMKTCDQVQDIEIRNKQLKRENMTLKLLYAKQDNKTDKEKADTFNKVYSGLIEANNLVIQMTSELKNSKINLDSVGIKNTALNKKISDLNFKVKEQEEMIKTLSLDRLELKEDKKRMMVFKQNNTNPRLLRILEMYTGNLDTSTQSKFRNMKFSSQIKYLDQRLQDKMKSIVKVLEERDKFKLDFMMKMLSNLYD